jgi:hypothetical protein
MNEIRVTRKEYRFHPMPRRRARIPFERTFTEKEFERVRLGVRHETMEDHWFICLDGKSLYFVRTWTAYCVYIARFGHGDDQYRIVEAWASRDPRQYGSTDAKYDAEMLAMVIEKVLLHPENSKPEG